MRRVWVRELTGWMLALAVALVTAATVADTARSTLLFRDGDSLVVAMLSRSILDGVPLDWAMSSVLFFPETAVFTAFDTLLPLDIDALLAVSAVVNLLALYGAFRFVAGRARDGRAPVGWSVIAVGVFGAIAMTEASGSRDALELASLQLTTTYYSATVVGAVLSVGAVRRLLDRSSRSVSLLAALGAIALVSTLTNPLFAAWATVPLAVLLAIGAVRSPLRSRVLVTLSVLVGATGIGFVARIPFAAWIANTGAGYAQPSQWRESLGSYTGLLVERLTTPPGAASAIVTLALLVAAVVLTARTTEPGVRLVASFAWVAPVLVVLGAIALGTHAARYLQPAVFAPVLVLLADPRIPGLARGVRRPLAVGAAVLVVIGGALSVPRLDVAAHAPDPDLTCVTDWVSASGRTGAGQFWTVRLPKAHLEDPAQLVQVDHRLDGYAWLVNRTDLDVGAVTFLVENAQTVPWELPISATPDAVVECGRYTILDFGATEIPIGPAHS